jgi:hypothetical protein
MDSGFDGKMNAKMFLIDINNSKFQIREQIHSIVKM